MNNRLDFNKIGRAIIKNFKEKYINSAGLISITYPPSNRTIFDNFDDIVPFFLFFNETEFLIDQIQILKKNYSFDKILANNNLIYSYQIDEFLGGLFCLWKKTYNTEIKEFLDFVLKKIKDYFIDKDNLFGTYDIYKKKRSKNYYYWSSGLLETFLEMSVAYPDLQNTVIKITDHWLSNKYFNKYHLFPFRWTDNSLISLSNKFALQLGRYGRHQPTVSEDNTLKNFIKKLQSITFTYFTSGSFTQLMKSNTTFIFTLIEIYRRTKIKKYKSVVLNWISAVIQNMCHDGIIFGIYYPRNNTKFDTSLANSFIFLDVLCDVYKFVDKNEQYINLAKKIIDKRLKRSWENSLIPIALNAKKTHIDSLIDFSVSLRRFADISNDESFKKKSYELMENIIKYHSSENGYYTHVTKEGNPINLNVNTISPKYNGLVLKGIISIQTLNKNMYEHLELHDLFKDR